MPATGPAPNTPASPPGQAGPDINIPPPNAASPPPATASGSTAGTDTATTPHGTAVAPEMGLSSTGLVIVLVVLVVWALLLLPLRRALSQGLLAQFADLNRSRAAGNTLYVFLLVFGGTLLLLGVGHYWTVPEAAIPAAILDLVLLVLFAVTLMSARASRQRR